MAAEFRTLMDKNPDKKGHLQNTRSGWNWTRGR